MKNILIIGGVMLVLVSGFFIFTSQSEHVEIVEEETKLPEDIAEHIDEKKNVIRVSSPSPLAVVTSPLKVSGEARGPWFFEASFPIVVTDWDGRILGEGIATAEGEWMTTEFVPFTAEIDFSVPIDTPYKRGTIIFRKDNPSGLPEHDDALEFPINFN